MRRRPSTFSSITSSRTRRCRRANAFRRAEPSHRARRSRGTARPCSYRRAHRTGGITSFLPCDSTSSAGGNGARSLARYFCFPHDLAPLLTLAVEVLGELLAPAGRGVQAMLGELGADLRIVQYFGELAIPEIKHLLRRLARRDEGVPVRRLEAGISQLRDGRHTRHRRRPLGAGRRKRAQLAGVD